jgi:pimeloyl-ACP methyl ester carboxylesterase
VKATVGLDLRDIGWQLSPEPGPTVVMLHEGRGSVSMWKDFPALLAQSTGCTVIAYCRLGHGRAERLRSPRHTRYMHDEALVCLPQFLDRWGIQNPVLFGHSDGGSIALIHVLVRLCEH